MVFDYYMVFVCVMIRCHFQIVQSNAPSDCYIRYKHLHDMLPTIFMRSSDHLLTASTMANANSIEIEIGEQTQTAIQHGIYIVAMQLCAQMP